MQPPSLQTTQQQILTLNSDDNPYQFTVADNTIVGTWKIADVKWAAILGAGTIDKEYSITVKLDEPNRIYTFNEHLSDRGSNINFNPMSGGLSFGKSSTMFSGKMVNKQFGFGVGTAVAQNGQLGNTYQYSFDTKKIKEPLFLALAQNGWQPKKSGLLNRLFGN